MTVDKGLDGEIADRIGEYVGLKGEQMFFLLGKRGVGADQVGF